MGIEQQAHELSDEIYHSQCYLMFIVGPLGCIKAKLKRRQARGLFLVAARFMWVRWLSDNVMLV